ncbi:MAG: histidine triad nucleotide-binding protein [Rhodospirillaceae bacterium]|nr:histidine triad nucleotide-binding protein [Rhodospirillaceae bacterium]|tara:strand:+ start:8096 stop:8449 length:354 start_codon:yes stop_codon:yes gene_type:complete
MKIESLPDCLFCKIVSNEISSERLYEDEEILVFSDIKPQAPFHALIIPKTHISTLNDLELRHENTFGRLFSIAKDLAEKYGYEGYRVVINTNKEGGQVIYHVHMHMLAGRQMKGQLG